MASKDLMGSRVWRVAVDVQKVRLLRERTGQPVLACRNAIVSAGGDVELARRLLLMSGSVYTTEAKNEFKKLIKRNGDSSRRE